MVKSLNTAVVAGGVVYSAGTAATPELEEMVTDSTCWVEDGTPAEFAIDAGVTVIVGPDPEDPAATVASEPVKPPARKRTASKKPAKA